MLVPASWRSLMLSRFSHLRKSCHDARILIFSIIAFDVGIVWIACYADRIEVRWHVEWEALDVVMKKKSAEA
jgi:hypothetical protein